MSDSFVVPGSVLLREERDPEPRLNWLRRLLGLQMKERRVYRWVSYQLCYRTPAGTHYLFYVIPTFHPDDVLRRMGLTASQVGVLALEMERAVGRGLRLAEWHIAAQEVRSLADQLVFEELWAASARRGTCMNKFAIETG